MFGLSQLHQLRGRVGRGRERAYAYFLYPPEKPLTETAHERLATIAQHTDLGAGMSVAMKDLEIRGAGNLLGGEQSGHIAGVGFDLYVRHGRRGGRRVLREAEGREAETAEVKVELPVDAHLPHDYVPGERLRLEAYRRIAGVHDDDGARRRPRRADDRYGPLPAPVVNLLAVARVPRRSRARPGSPRSRCQGNHVRFAPGRPARVAGSCGCSGCTRRARQGGDQYPAGADAEDGAAGRAAAARPGAAGLGPRPDRRGAQDVVRCRSPSPGLSAAPGSTLLRMIRSCD